MIEKILARIKELKATEEGRKKLVMYAVVGLVVFGALVYNLGSMGHAYNEGTLVSDEVRLTRGQRAAKARAYLQDKTDAMDAGRFDAAEQYRKTQERLRNLQK